MACLFLLLTSITLVLAGPNSGFPSNNGGCPQAPPPFQLDPSNLPTPIINAINQARMAVEDQLDEQHTSGFTMGIIQDQQLLWSGGFGLKNISDPTSLPDLNTIFRLASVSKVFSAIQLLIMQEQGKLNIEDEVQKYVPDFTVVNPFSESTRKITFRQLATHLSGLPREAPCDISDCNITYREAYSRIANFKLIFPPDTLSVYSNLGFDILGNSLAEISGLSFNDMVQQSIFNPLKMINSGANINNANKSLLALPYWPGGILCENCLFDFGWAEPAGSFYSNIKDLATFISFLFRDDVEANPNGGQILDGASIRESMLIRDLHHDRRTGFAMPWELWTLGDYVLRAKGGDVNGYSSQIMMSPELKVGVVILSNEDGRAQTPGYRVSEIIFPAFDAYYRSMASVVLPPNPSSYVGLYDGDGTFIEIYQPNIPTSLVPVPLIGSPPSGDGAFQLTWLGLAPPNQHLFQRAPMPGDSNTCFNLVTILDYQTIEFQVGSDNSTIISFTQDIQYGVVYKKVR